MPWAAEETTSVRAAEPVQVVREPRLAEVIVCVGGHPGCGKSLLTSVIGSLARTEIQKYNYIIEHLCALALLDKMDHDAAVAMIRMMTDLDLYHLMMSRELNLRWQDLSSIFKNPNPWRYLRRLWLPGDAAAVERIRHERPILHYLMHNALVISPPLFAALEDRLRVVLVVRHPLYMLKQWHRYIDRYGTDARDFTIWIEAEGQAVPFFARGWEERYLRANSMDRVIYSIQHLSRLEQHVLEGLSERQRSQVLVIPFERFVLDPWSFLRQLETLLGTTGTRRTVRELKRQHVPRKMIAEGIPEPIYRQYGWQPPRKRSTEREELALRRDFAARLASAEGMRVLDRLCADYEAAYLGDGLL
ncbi:MAG: hypothetical protein HYZ89_01770 [Candidatus Omnitrophica bacterium]|nr:hypothetical protein [Candidatus Omnitrophota bacterium]